MSVIINGTDGVTFNDTSLQGAAASPYGLKNRIINGDMRIDQRNAGAAITLNSSAQLFPVDRWSGFEDSDGVMTAQQDSSAPNGFVNSIKFTTTTDDATLGATQRVNFRQRIEGYNIADLGWGTADAKTVTLSFWTSSSLTGTFGGSIINNALDRSYPFTYTISTANTWELKSVTIAGDTTGTWLTTNGIGMQVIFGLGVGSTYSGTAGSWAATRYESATGATSVVGTNGATFFITGVQLEQNTVATPFERRLYGQEFINCQRYYEVITSDTGGLPFMLFLYVAAGGWWNFWSMSTRKRVSPTVALASGGTWTNGTPTITAGVDTITFNSAGQSYLSSSAGTPALTASAEL